MSEHVLHRIGELSKLAGVSSRTIDFYTSMGLIEPERRSAKNYRLYSDETLNRLKRIVQLKKDKYTLDEIKANMAGWRKVSTEEQVSGRLMELQLHLEQLQREVQEIEPVLNQLKPQQAKQVFKRLVPQTAACVEALMLLINKGGIM
ncbi:MULTISPECIES: MerR family transcriptional regulator [Paenibacillus]|uniref:MerR family transcriptional regulator n=1 Tax=Paenibacillus lignilyticus TaxID=1172615 RepID=A0ABS5C7B7_9BACL|nr:MULTISPECIES: MerR family transcriptional regulator [Paenibacillus]MBP3961340.1 MerR family transcriptional regulator [Paenibacillus lignilyticus]SFS59269.1 DNA-binding transcriptional regulator, MerR family [Paenibacillus sp. BC26]